MLLAAEIDLHLIEPCEQLEAQAGMYASACTLLEHTEAHGASDLEIKQIDDPSDAGIAGAEAAMDSTTIVVGPLDGTGPNLSGVSQDPFGGESPALAAPGAPETSAAAGACRRRDILGTAASMLAIGGPEVSADPGGLDAEIVVLCAAFDELERRIDALDVEDYDERERLIAPIVAAQASLVERICALRADTSEGDRARAKSFLLWNKEIDPVRDAMSTNRPWGDRVMAALLRDLVGRS